MNRSTTINVRVRAADGSTRDDGWVRRGELGLRRRLGEAAIFLAVGGTLGAVFLLIPLIHLLGVMVAAASLGLSLHRLRSRRVLAGAGGTCPRCGREAAFFVGFGRQRFRLPVGASCGACGIALTLIPF